MTNFQYIEKVLSKDTFCFRIKENGGFITFKRLLDLWEESPEFCKFYNNILKEVPFISFFWENRPVSKDCLDKVYEFVIVKTDAFHGKRPDCEAFVQHFKKSYASYCNSDGNIVSFPNLGNDAQLIVPCPVSTEDYYYTHLATFIRNAPILQVQAFWKEIASQLKKQINSRPLWLSTSGLGINWLHARIDQAPKYYTFSPYKTLEQ